MHTHRHRHTHTCMHAHPPAEYCTWISRIRNYDFLLSDQSNVGSAACVTCVCCVCKYVFMHHITVFPEERDMQRWLSSLHKSTFKVYKYSMCAIQPRHSHKHIAKYTPEITVHKAVRRHYKCHHIFPTVMSLQLHIVRAIGFYSVACISAHICGYIHYIDVVPFHVCVYTHTQTNMHVELIEDLHAVLVCVRIYNTICSQHCICTLTQPLCLS